MKFNYQAGNGWQSDAQEFDDRGQQFGDGLFETVRLDGRGVAPLWQMHVERLALGLKALRYDSVQASGNERRWSTRIRIHSRSHAVGNGALFQCTGVFNIPLRCWYERYCVIDSAIARWA